MAFEELRSKLDRLTSGKTPSQKATWFENHMARWAVGNCGGINKKQLVSTLTCLNFPATVANAGAEEVFAVLDPRGTDPVGIQDICTLLISDPADYRDGGSYVGESTSSPSRAVRPGSASVATGPEGFFTGVHGSGGSEAARVYSRASYTSTNPNMPLLPGPPTTGDRCTSPASNTQQSFSSHAQRRDPNVRTGGAPHAHSQENLRSGPLLPNVQEEDLDFSKPVVDHFRCVVFDRGGVHGMQLLYRVFRIMDSDHSMLVGPHEVQDALSRLGVRVQRDDAITLLRAVDVDGKGRLTVDDFLRGVRGDVSSRRRKNINMVFDALDNGNEGVVTLMDLRSMYDPSQHPEVLQGKMGVAEALEHLMSQFDSCDQDDVITRRDFTDYYKNLSVSIDDDVRFERMLRRMWHMTVGEGVSASAARNRR